MQPPKCPPRPADGHKGTFGTVLVWAGSMTMAGAAALSARAALRAGAGLAKLAVDAEMLATALVLEPSATAVVRPAAPTTEKIAACLDAVDPGQRAVLAVGPGLLENGQPGEDNALAVRVMLDGPRRVVLDAGGLNLLARMARQGESPGLSSPTVVTPHPGEFRRLAEAFDLDPQVHDPVDPQRRSDAAVGLARRLQAVVVLKGSGAIVTDGDRVYRNATGNPALSTAGSGDVLTGVIAGLMAQRMSPFDAAVLGVYLHGLAADQWRDRHGPSGLLARELADLLPDAFEAHRRRAPQPAADDDRSV